MPATEMLQTHPSKTQVDPRLIQACIEACFDCAQTCTACADACLGEQQYLQTLVRCIRLNLDRAWRSSDFPYAGLAIARPE